MYVLVVVSAPVLNDPDVAPPWSQDVALVEEYEIVDEPLYKTDVGEAETETVGGGLPTLTVTLLLPDPPGPVQVTVYEVFVVNAPVPNEPDEPP